MVGQKVPGQPVADRQLTGRPVAQGQVLDDGEPRRLPQRGVNLSPADELGSQRSDNINQVLLSQIILKIPGRGAAFPMKMDL